METNTLDSRQMQEVSVGIARGMEASDIAYRLADNGLRGDARVVVYFLNGVRVAATNGDPIWEESDLAAFAELLESQGITLPA